MRVQSKEYESDKNHPKKHRHLLSAFLHGRIYGVHYAVPMALRIARETKAKTMTIPPNSIIHLDGIGDDRDGRLAPMTKWFSEQKELFNGKAVLDLASNAGHFPMMFARLGATLVTAVEPRKVFSDFYNGELSWRAGGNKVSWIVSDVESYNPVGAFDIVTCLGLIYHMNDGWSHLKRIIDACRAKTLILDTMLFDKHSWMLETARLNSNCTGIVKLVEKPTKKLVESMLDSFGWSHEMVLCDWQNTPIKRGMWRVTI